MCFPLHLPLSFPGGIRPAPSSSYQAVLIKQFSNLCTNPLEPCSSEPEHYFTPQHKPCSPEPEHHYRPQAFTMSTFACGRWIKFPPAWICLPSLRLQAHQTSIHFWEYTVMIKRVIKSDPSPQREGTSAVPSSIKPFWRPCSVKRHNPISLPEIMEFH